MVHIADECTHYASNGSNTVSHIVPCTQIDISRFTGDMRAEWEGFREHDVVFLVCIENPLPDAVARLVEFERYALLIHINHC